jgi:hypothetical protein
MEPKDIEQKPSAIDGWKTLHGGGLLGGKAKKSLKNWQTSAEKGVMPALYIVTRLS